MASKRGPLVNLLPKDDFERTTLGRIMKWALTSFRFIVIVVEFIVIAGFLLRFWLDVQISDLEDEIAQKSALISSKASFEKEFRAVQAKITLLKEITAEDNVSLSLFRLVTESLPTDTQLTSFTRKADLILVNGATLNENSIAGFISNLEAKDKVDAVTLQQISTSDTGPLIEFSLEVRLSRGG